MNEKTFTAGQMMGLRILIANELGLDVGYNDEAYKLFRQQSVNPCLIGTLSMTAHEAINEVNKRNLAEQAYSIFSKIVGSEK